VAALHEIRVAGHPALPDTSGYAPVQIEFRHAEGCVIELENPPAGAYSVEQEEMRTHLAVPADPTWDRTGWIIRPQGGSPVKASLLVERVWWALDRTAGGEQAVGWTDAPLELSRDWITATSNYALRFRLPRPRWTDEIQVGFEWLKARTYPVEVAAQEIVVPLSDFEGAMEVEDRASEHQLKLWVEREAAQSPSGAVVARIPAIQTAASAPLRQGRLRSDLRRGRKYLRRLSRRTRDSALRELIQRFRARFVPTATEPLPHSLRAEMACLIALAWEVLKAEAVQPPSRRKRWLRRLVRAAGGQAETMERLREDYERLKSGSSVTAQRKQR
jgi:hypothetical protein